MAEVSSRTIAVILVTLLFKKMRILKRQSLCRGCDNFRLVVNDNHENGCVPIGPIFCTCRLYTFEVFQILKSSFFFSFFLDPPFFDGKQFRVDEMP